MTDIGTALVQLAPTAEWTVRGTEIEWHSKDISQPSNDAINAKIDETLGIGVTDEELVNACMEVLSFVALDKI